jgi:hypothetical protein
LRLTGSRLWRVESATHEGVNSATCLLVLERLLIREVILGDVHATELSGPRDIVHVAADAAGEVAAAKAAGVDAIPQYRQDVQNRRRLELGTRRTRLRRVRETLASLG